MLIALRGGGGSCNDTWDRRFDREGQGRAGQDSRARESDSLARHKYGLTSLEKLEAVTYILAV
jgi:hypothetical protein